MTPQQQQEIVDFVKSLRTSLSFDGVENNNLVFSTRDIKEAKRVALAVREKFPTLKTHIKGVDEWTMPTTTQENTVHDRIAAAIKQQFDAMQAIGDEMPDETRRRHFKSINRITVLSVARAIGLDIEREAMRTGEPFVFQDFISKCGF